MRMGTELPKGEPPGAGSSAAQLAVPRLRQLELTGGVGMGAFDLPCRLAAKVDSESALQGIDRIVGVGKLEE